ncbi:MAG: hypothetical protein PHR82_06425 [Endomicrobiaceae bacterium]|nr:hypothetical protein [Endomicrobiaceae bacterium]
MDKRDMELKLLSDKPIMVGSIPVYPISIDEIASIGYLRYNSELRILCLTNDDIKLLAGKDIGQIGVFHYLVGNALNDKEILDMMIFWFSIVTHKEIVFSKNTLTFDLQDGSGLSINSDNFDEIQTIIRCRNGLMDYEEEVDNPENDAARRVLARRKEERMKRKKNRSASEDSDGDDINLSDLVSILASGLHLPISEIMAYDLYQFNNQFNRLKIMDDYEVSVQALLHGAKKNDIHFTHWITKIKAPEQ